MSPHEWDGVGILTACNFSPQLCESLMSHGQYSAYAIISGSFMSTLDINEPNNARESSSALYHEIQIVYFLEPVLAHCEESVALNDCLRAPPCTAGRAHCHGQEIGDATDVNRVGRFSCVTLSSIWTYQP